MIAHPYIRQIRETVRRIAPCAPQSLAEVIASMLANPRASSDCLLLLADAMREVAVMPEVHPMVRHDLRRLADQIAEVAPSRANVPLPQSGD